MEYKKAKEVDLEKKRPQFLVLGLCSALALLLVAFNYRTSDLSRFDEPFLNAEIIEDEISTPVVILKENPKPKIKISKLRSAAVNTKPIVIEVLIGKTSDKSWDDILGSEDYDDELFAEEKEDKEEIPAPPRTWVEKMPSFVGGEREMFAFLGKNLRYPVQARDAGIEGIVYVEFVVEKDGSITNEKVYRSLGGGCEEAALKAVKRMPKWIPGSQGGQNVRVLFRLPVNFKLNN